MENYNSLSCLSNEHLSATLKKAETIGLHLDFLHLLLDEIRKRNLSIDQKNVDSCGTIP